MRQQQQQQDDAIKALNAKAAEAMEGAEKEKKELLAIVEREKDEEVKAITKEWADKAERLSLQKYQEVEALRNIMDLLEKRLEAAQLSGSEEVQAVSATLKNVHAQEMKLVTEKLAAKDEENGKQLGEIESLKKAVKTLASEKKEQAELVERLQSEVRLLDELQTLKAEHGALKGSHHKQQEELVMLRGTVRRQQEEGLGKDEEVVQLAEALEVYRVENQRLLVCVCSAARSLLVGVGARGCLWLRGAS